MLLQSLIFFSSNHLKIDISLKAEHMKKTGYIMRRLNIIKNRTKLKNWLFDKNTKHN
jgi:hypothetical protein